MSIAYVDLVFGALAYLLFLAGYFFMIWYKNKRD